MRSQIAEVKPRRTLDAPSRFHLYVSLDSLLAGIHDRRMPLPRRVLALDVGSRRIGVAVSDLLGITAQGLETIQRQNKRKDWAALGAVLEKYDVGEIVVGLPLRLSGAEGTQSEKMRVFAGELHAKFRLPVHLWDERWTSTEANRLLRETNLSIEKRGKAVDRMAAILILQAWLEARRSGGERAESELL